MEIPDLVAQEIVDDLRACVEGLLMPGHRTGPWRDFALLRLPISHRVAVAVGVCHLGKRLSFDRLNGSGKTRGQPGTAFEQGFEFRAQSIAALGRERVKR
jgi:hypothetical protein